MWKRATKDTLSFFGWNKRTLIVPILLWLLGAIIYYFWQGKQAMLEEITVAVSFALIPIGVFLLGLFLFHLIRAPVYIKWEREKEPRLIVTLAPNLEPGDKKHWLRLRVENPSRTPIAGCYGKVNSYTMLIQGKRVTETPAGQSLNDGLPPERHSFVWSSVDLPETTITIPGQGHEFLYIAVMQNQMFYTPTDMGLKYPKPLLSVEFEVVIDIGSEVMAFPPTRVSLVFETEMNGYWIKAKQLFIVPIPDTEDFQS